MASSQVCNFQAPQMSSFRPALTRAKYKGKETTLDSAIEALRERKIILYKEGERGTYRLQHRGFALWIKLFTSDPDAIQGGLAQLSLPNETPSE
jgi:hypothetical protein